MKRFLHILSATMLAALIGCGGGGGGFDLDASRVVVATDQAVQYVENGENVQNLVALFNLAGRNQAYYGVRTPELLPARIAQAATWTSDPLAAVRVWMDGTGRPTWLRQGNGIVVFFAWIDDLNAVVQCFQPEWTEIGTSRIRFTADGYEVLPLGTGASDFSDVPPAPPTGSDGTFVQGRTPFTDRHLAEMARLLETIHTRTPGLRAFFAAMGGGAESGVTRRDLGIGIDVPEASVVEIANLFAVNLQAIPRGADFTLLVNSAQFIGTSDDFR